MRLLVDLALNITAKRVVTAERINTGIAVTKNADANTAVSRINRMFMTNLKILSRLKNITIRRVNRPTEDSLTDKNRYLP